MNDIKTIRLPVTEVAVRNETDTLDLASFAKAVSHPMRIRILQVLAQRKSCVCGDIVDELPLAQSTVSEHLKILRNAGLIAGEVDGPRVCYCLDPSGMSNFRNLVQKLTETLPLCESCNCQEENND